MTTHFSNLGFGIGLRPPHYETIIAQQPDTIDWFEIISEDYLVPGGKPHYYLEQIAERYPIIMHGVSLSIASVDPLNLQYLEQLKQLATRYQVPWLSDHLCWTGVQGNNLHDLLPVPYTEEALAFVTERVKQVQDILGRHILLENPSTYLQFKQSTMPEWEFMARLAEQADCFILLDVNNVYVSSVNHHFEPKTYFDAIPVERVKQFHIAGHHHHGTHIIDTHDAPVIDAVWQWYAYAVKRFPNVPTLLERDDNIPPLPDLVAELSEARRVAGEVEMVPMG